MRNGFVRYIWASTYPPQPRCLTNEPWLKQHVPAQCHCSLEWEWGWLWDSQISQHAFLRCSLMKTLSGNYATWLMKLTDTMNEIYINGKFSLQEPSKWIFVIPVKNCNVFQPRIWTDFRGVGIKSSGCFENYLGQEFDSCHTAAKMLPFSGQNVVNFSIPFL